MKGYATLKRYDMTSVMAHSGFGKVTVKLNGHHVDIPTTVISQEGLIRKSIAHNVRKALLGNHSAITELQKKGIEVI